MKKIKKENRHRGIKYFILSSFYSFILSSCNTPTTDSTMFEIEEQPFGKYTQYNLKNTFTGEYVSVIPAFGATLNQIALKKGDKVYELVNGCKNYDELITEGKSKFKGSKLFPFPNRIVDGQYSFENKVYNLPINFPQEKNAIHGIVLESDFKVIQKLATADSALLTVQYKTVGNEAGYPFKVLVTIEYVLTKEGFSANTILENADQQNIPVGDGWHPYFKTGSKVDDCILTLPIECSYEVDTRMIPTGKTIIDSVFSKPTKIADSKFDTGYKLAKTESKTVFTKVEDPAQDITLVLWQEVGEGKFNYLQVYTPPDRQSIALEPMTCLADAFNNKEGLIVLKPGEKRNFSFGLKLE